MFKISKEVLEDDKFLIKMLIEIIEEENLTYHNLLNRAKKQLKLLEEEYYV